MADDVIEAVFPRRVQIVRRSGDAGEVRLSEMDLLDLLEDIANATKGETGNDGAPGAEGQPGKDGKDGRDGMDGRDGVDGRDGKDGKDGKDGRDGIDGRPGKDGLPPAHEIGDGQIRFKKPDGNWGEWVKMPAGAPSRPRMGGISNRVPDQPLDANDDYAVNSRWVRAYVASVGGGGGGPVAWDDVTGKPTEFTPEAHTHTASEVSDFAEAVDDRVASLLTAGSGISLSYNDTLGALAIAATGGGGGMSWTTIHNATPTASAQIVVDLTGYSIFRWKMTGCRHNSGSLQSIVPYLSVDGGSTYTITLASSTGTAVNTTDFFGAGMFFFYGSVLRGIGNTGPASFSGTITVQGANNLAVHTSIAFRPSGGNFQAVGNITVEGLI